MTTKEYTLSNGVKVTQKELSLRKLFAVAELVSSAVLEFFRKLFSGDDKIDFNVLKVFMMDNLLNPDNANKFLNIILISPDGKPIDYLDLPVGDWMDAVEDFFILNGKLITKLKSLSGKLDSLTQILKSADSEEKSSVTAMSSTQEAESKTEEPLPS